MLSEDGHIPLRFSTYKLNINHDLSENELLRLNTCKQL